MSFVDNEQVNIEIFSVPELERILTRTPDRVELIFNTKSKSEVWKTFRLIRVDEIIVPNLCACLRCKSVFTTFQNAGTSHLLQHQKSSRVIVNGVHSGPKKIYAGSCGPIIYLRAAGRINLKLRAAGRAAVTNFGPRATLIHSIKNNIE